jgi:hypothetical protein
MQHLKNASNANQTEKSVIKVVSSGSALTWVSPVENEVLKITQDAGLPAVEFEFTSQSAGDYKWSWVIEWQAKVSGLRERERKGDALQVFSDSGSFVSKSTKWTLDFAGRILGGKLSVTVSVGQSTIVRTVIIKGQNPSKESVAAYVATLDDMSGFEKLLEQETKSKHFIDLDGEPIVAFDKGYGITQTTNPAPSYEEIWNWKANILAGSSIYKEKVRAAKKYLGQADRVCTDDQLQHEVFSCWNGGSYHQWDSASNSWIRKSNPREIAQALANIVRQAQSGDPIDTPAFCRLIAVSLWAEWGTVGNPPVPAAARMIGRGGT